MTAISWRPAKEGFSYAVGLTVLVAIAHFALIPFITQILSPSGKIGRPGELGQAFGALFDILLSYLLIRFSLNLGRRVGLGWPPIDGWDGEPSSPSRTRDAVVTAALLGAAVALCVSIVSVVIGDRWHIRTPQPTLWALGLASLGAGIHEEVWFRLGAMTIVAAIMTKLSGRATSTSPIIWSANLVAAVLFGAAHLPQTSAFATLSPSLVTFILAANGAVGLVCGWLYWRRGLLAAMIAHTAVDLVLKVALPMLYVDS